MPLSVLPAKLQAQQIFYSYSETLHKNNKEKLSATHNTKEIKINIQAQYSECNTKFTVKPSSECFPTFSFVWCPYLTIINYGHFNNTDLSN
jgi:hypothetical protein